MIEIYFKAFKNASINLIKAEFPKPVFIFPLISYKVSSYLTLAISATTLVKGVPVNFLPLIDLVEAKIKTQYQI